MTDEVEASLQEVLAEMDDRTRIGWDLAVANVEKRKLRAALAEALNGQQPAAPPLATPTTPGQETEGG